MAGSEDPIVGTRWSSDSYWCVGGCRSYPAVTTTEPITVFDDLAVDELFAYEVAWLAEAGITRGCNPPDNDEFCPDAVVTRGQMAAFLVRAFGYIDRGTTDFVDDDGSIFEADIERLAAAGVTGL